MRRLLIALTALVASQAPEGDRGAVLGGLQTLQELVSAAGYPLYGRLLASGLKPRRSHPRRPHRPLMPCDSYQPENSLSPDSYQFTDPA